MLNFDALINVPGGGGRDDALIKVPSLGLGTFHNGFLLGLVGWSLCLF